VALVVIAGMFMLAPAQDLTFEGVRYSWTNDMIEVQGNVRNTSSTTMTVPRIVIALRDESGEEISEWTTEVSAEKLSAGEQAPFLQADPVAAQQRPRVAVLAVDEH
jgi:hypothetical protein